MGEEKGIMSKAVEAIVEEGLDRVINAKGVVEVASDMAIKVLVPVIDNNLAEKLADEIKEPLRNAGDLLLEGKFEEAAEAASEVLSATIDIPGMDETDEQRIARKICNLVADVLVTEINIRKKEQEDVEN